MAGLAQRSQVTILISAALNSWDNVVNRRRRCHTPLRLALLAKAPIALQHFGPSILPFLAVAPLVTRATALVAHPSVVLVAFAVAARLISQCATPSDSANLFNAWGHNDHLQLGAAPRCYTGQPVSLESDSARQFG